MESETCPFPGWICGLFEAVYDAHSSSKVTFLISSTELTKFDSWPVYSGSYCTNRHDILNSLTTQSQVPLHAQLVANLSNVFYCDCWTQFLQLEHRYDEDVMQRMRLYDQKIIWNSYGGRQFFFKTLKSISLRDGWLISHITIVFQTKKQNEKWNSKVGKLLCVLLNTEALKSKRILRGVSVSALFCPECSHRKHHDHAPHPHSFFNASFVFGIIKIFLTNWLWSCDFRLKASYAVISWFLRHYLLSRSHLPYFGSPHFPLSNYLLLHTYLVFVNERAPKKLCIKHHFPLIFLGQNCFKSTGTW